MRFSPTMRNVVLQATAICTISLLYTHYVSENMFDAVIHDETFSHLAGMFDNATAAEQAHNARLEKMQKSVIPKDEADNYVMRTVNETNGTTWSYFVPKNQTELIPNTKNATKESFYGRELPREVLIVFILVILQYWWFVGLEKILPARPRRRDVTYQGKEKVEESEDREEEVVKKWIAQGRVNRASLNICNTFLKWVLELTVGTLWFLTVQHVLRQLLKLNSPMSVFVGLKSHLIFGFLGTFFSVAPFVRLIAFVVVPAYKQILFIEAIELVWAVFTMQFLRMMASWAVKTEFVQAVMRNVTGEMEQNPEKFGRVGGREL
ncbi:unnamed protein product [Alternaria alternata]|jgi:hypothetical protein|uniref:Uncharacterized protein n=2 Tax=Alternaria alternata complex TaxID=187734 RepID=A0A4Q4NQC7_ALTAL|nr:hypothetical protein AALT_g3354 [Alternaria alternata]RYN27056.1 hypothetical protein AA0115_g6601 [Alternaria tenuissima]RYN59119.1 hypothetical protein AA0114_g1720 [Alternaria tenuissima]RYN79758.1 hypothetical protein AA0117_g3643 [Alternaria alternata]RYN98321.1 hypothetical protein AA0120_g2620 [Alternaria tenuissima]